MEVIIPSSINLLGFVQLTWDVLEDCSVISSHMVTDLSLNDIFRSLQGRRMSPELFKTACDLPHASERRTGLWNPAGCGPHLFSKRSRKEDSLFMVGGEGILYIPLTRLRYSTKKRQRWGLFTYADENYCHCKHRLTPKYVFICSTSNYHLLLCWHDCVHFTGIISLKSVKSHFEYLKIENTNLKSPKIPSWLRVSSCA